MPKVVLIQHIKLENEGWERDAAVPEPQEPTIATSQGMSAPPSAEPLETWERGLGLPPALRTLTLPGATKEGSSLDGLANLTIGELDPSFFIRANAPSENA